VRFDILLHGSALLNHLVTSVYEGRHSGSLLKIKTSYDAEAIVVGHVPGKGRNKDITGALSLFCRKTIPSLQTGVFA